MRLDAHLVTVFNRLPDVTPAVQHALEKEVQTSLTRIVAEASKMAPRSSTLPHHPPEPHMAEKFTAAREGLEGEVGNTSDHFLYVEEGTRAMPPRPSLGPATQMESLELQRRVPGAVRDALPR